MKKIIILLFIFILIQSIYSEEYDFLESNEVVYSKIETNLDGDDIKDELLEVTTRDQVAKKEHNQKFMIGIRNIYILLNSREGLYKVEKIDVSRPYSFSIELHKKASIWLGDTELGLMNNLFFINDHNKNGIMEIYYLEYIREDQYFVGIEFNGNNFAKIIDIPIEGYYKYNLKKNNEHDLILLGKMDYEVIDKKEGVNIYQGNLLYFKFEIDEQKYRLVKTEQIKVSGNDIF